MPGVWWRVVRHPGGEDMKNETPGTSAADIENIEAWFGSAGLDGCNGEGRGKCNVGSVSCLAGSDTLALAIEVKRLRAKVAALEGEPGWRFDRACKGALGVFLGLNGKWLANDDSRYDDNGDGVILEGRYPTAREAMRAAEEAAEAKEIEWPITGPIRATLTDAQLEEIDNQCRAEPLPKAETYNEKTDRFFKETGKIAPGRDVPAAWYQDEDEAKAAWVAWCAQEAAKGESE